MDKNFLSGFDAPAFKLQDQTTPVTTTPTATTTPKQVRGRGGTLTSLISEGGALGGAAAGAAIGSAVPVIGTAIGGVIGAGIGAFGGRLLENKVRDDRLGVTDAAKEGAISAVLAGPLKIGKYGATAAKGLKAGTALTPALTKAAEEATAFTLRSAAGKGITQASKDLVLKQFRINPSQLTNFGKKHGEDITDIVSRYKVSNIDDIASKGINPLLSVFDDIVDNIPDIPKKNLKTILDEEIQVLLKSPVQTNKLLGKRLQSQANTLLKSQPSKIPGQIAKQLRQEFDDSVKYTLAGTPERTVAKRTADSLRKLLQNAAEDASLTGPNGLSVKELGLEISKLIDLDEIVKKQSNLGRGSLPFGITSGLGAITGALTGAGTAGAGGAAIGGPVGAITGAALTQALNSPTGRRLLAQTGQAIGGRLTESGATAVSRPITQAVLGAGRAGLVGGAGRAALGGGVQQPTTLEQALTTIPPTTQGFAPSTVTGGIAPAPVEQSPYSRENLLYDIQRDPKNADNYIKYYQELQKVYAAPKTEKLTTTAIKQFSDYQKSLANLDEVESLILQNKGAFGPLRGTIRGAIPQDVTAKAIRQATLIASQNVGRALEGGKLTDEDILRYQQALPKITDTPEVALNKIDRLRRLISQESQTYGQLTTQLGGAQSLEDALLEQTGGTR